MAFEQYEHQYSSGGSAFVWVDSELKGKHRDHCLCFKCGAFKPNDRARNCVAASQLFHMAKVFSMVMPVYECPNFIESKKVVGR